MLHGVRLDDVTLAFLGVEDEVIEVVFLLESRGNRAGHDDAVGSGRVVVRLLLEMLVEVGDGKHHRPAVQSARAARRDLNGGHQGIGRHLQLDGGTPSTVGPEKRTATLLPRLAASGKGVVAQGKSPIRSR